MSVELSGEEILPKTQNEVWDKLMDLEFLIRCFPDVESVLNRSPDRVVFRVRPGFSFLRGTLENTLEIVEKNPPSSARMTIKGKGIGASVAVETILDLSPSKSEGAEEGASGTLLHWRAAVTEQGGLLKAVSKGLLEGAARKVVGDAWSAFRRELG